MFFNILGVIIEVATKNSLSLASYKIKYVE